MRIRPAVRADFEAFGVPILFRVKAIAGVDENGDVIALGGWGTMPDGRRAGFAELTDKARAKPVALHKAALGLLEKMKSEGVTSIFALADLEASPKAEKWLARLGFERVDMNGRQVWRWEAE